MTVQKIATSLPAAQFASVERLRRKLKLNRSQVVQEALTLWLAARSTGDLCDQYLRGYLRQPEDASEAKAMVRAWATGLEPEDWQ